MKMFHSDELIGTNKEEKLFHGLGKVPSVVIAYPSSMSFVEYSPQHKNHLVIQGGADAKTSLRRRDLWPMVITEDSITMKVVTGKKYRVIAFA